MNSIIKRSSPRVPVPHMRRGHSRKHCGPECPFALVIPLFQDSDKCVKDMRNMANCMAYFRFVLKSRYCFLFVSNLPLSCVRPKYRLSQKTNCYGPWTIRPKLASASKTILFCPQHSVCNVGFRPPCLAV